MNIEKSITVFSILILTNVFGIYRIPKIIIEGKDLILVVMVLYSIYLFFTKKALFSDLMNGCITQNFFFFLFLVIIVSLSMEFRDTGNLYTGLKAGRIYIYLLIFVPVYVDIIAHKRFKFWVELIYSIGLTYSSIIFLNVLMPSITQSIFTEFSYMASERSWGMNTTRFVVKSNYGILFVHLAFVVSLFKIISSRHNNKMSFFYTFYLFTSLFFQGWRAIMFSLFLCILLIFFIVYKRRVIATFLKCILLSVTLIAPIDASFDQIITSKFISGYYEITGQKSGTLQGRLKRAEVYALPHFLKKKWFGYGFISEKEESLQKNSRQKAYDKTNLLYNQDFGHLTLLVMFGIIGFVIVFFLFFRAIIKSYLELLKQKDLYAVATFIVFFLSLIIANYSFGGLVSITGILPLAMAIGMAQAELRLRTIYRDDI